MQRISVLLSGALAFATLARSATDTNFTKEELRKQLFKDKAGTAGCLSVGEGLDGSLGRYDKELGLTVSKLLDGLRKKDPAILIPLFHPRLRIGSAAVGDTLASLSDVYKEPWQISLYRAWALNSVDGTPTMLTCAADGAKAKAFYGYPLQFGVWLQVMGQNELGRIYVALVPVKDRWYIGAFDVHQATQGGKSPGTWQSEGASLAKRGLTPAAFVKYDIATKLLEAGPHLSLARESEISAEKNKLYASDEAWRDTVKKQLAPWKPVYVGTILAKDGAGVLVRFPISRDSSAIGAQDECKKLGRTLLKEPWFQALDALKCSFIYPGEDPSNDGKMGSIYYTKAELTAKHKG